MDKTSILNKIKDFYNFKKDSDFSRFLGITPQVLYNWKMRNTYDPHLIYTKCLDINPEWLLSGNGSMLKNDYLIKNTPLASVKEYSNTLTNTENNLKNIPLYDIESSGGLNEILNKNSPKAHILDFIKIPTLTDSDGAIFAKGDSMFPTIKSGDIILFKKISLKNIFWGEMFLVEITDEKDQISIIRYIQKSNLGDNFIKLVSENPDYESKDLSINRINAIALIRAHIRPR